MTRWDEFKRKWLPTPWHAARRNLKELPLLLELTGRHRTIDAVLNNTLRYIESYLFDPDAVDAATVTPELAETWCKSQISNSREYLSKIQIVEFSYKPQTRAFSVLRNLQELKVSILEYQTKRLQQRARAGILWNKEVIDLNHIEYQHQLLELHQMEAEYFAALRDATWSDNPKQAIYECSRLRSVIFAELTKAIVAALEFDFDTARSKIQGTSILFKTAAEELAKATQNIEKFRTFIGELRNTLGESNELVGRLVVVSSDFPAEVGLSQDLLDALANFTEAISEMISQPFADEQDKLDRVARIKGAVIQIARYSGKLSNLSDKRLDVLSDQKSRLQVNAPEK